MDEMMNGKITVVDVLFFFAYMVIVVGGVRLVGKHHSEGIDMIAATAGICSWPFVRRRLYKWLYDRLSRCEPPGSRRKNGQPPPGQVG